MSQRPVSPRRRRGAPTLLAALLGGCTAPAPASVEALAFPVLVLFEQSGTVRHDDPADLRTMSVQRVAGSDSPPFLIDARFDIYRLEQLQSVHGGLWLMANPSGSTEVSFDLVRVGRGDVERARTLIAQREPRLRSGTDPEAATRLAQATQWTAMLAAIDK